MRDGVYDPNGVAEAEIINNSDDFLLKNFLRSNLMIRTFYTNYENDRHVTTFSKRSSRKSCLLVDC